MNINAGEGRMIVGSAMAFIANNREFHATFRRPTQPVHWIVSYPRSGNTFLRTLIANYFSGLDRPLELAEIVDSTRGEHDEQLWLQLTGRQPGERTVDDEWRHRAAYNDETRARANPSLPLVKAHTMNCAIGGVPAFHFDPRDRIVHIVRHPCDVAVSLAQFSAGTLDEAIKHLLLEGAASNDPPNYGYEVTGSWAQHTRSWMEPICAPILRIRYMDLVERTVDLLMDVVTFLGSRPDRCRAEQAAAFSNFRQLQSQEQQGGFAEMPAGRGRQFFHRGRPGQWLGAMTIDQALALQNELSDLMKELGFARLILRQNTGS